MAQQEWADKVIETYQCGPCRGKVHVEDVAKLFTNEHARAVRIVKVAIVNEKKEMADDPYNEGLYEYTIDKLREVLTALQRGRGGRG